MKKRIHSAAATLIAAVLAVSSLTPSLPAAAAGVALSEDTAGAALSAQLTSDDDDAEDAVHTSKEAPESYTTITIESVEDYLELADSCHVDSWSLDKAVVLEADLDFTGVGFEPIAVFSGTFDGQGHTMSGIEITDTVSDTGVFEIIQNTGVVSNLNVEADITPSGYPETIGGIAGTNYGLISACTFSGTLEADAESGGIAGRNAQSGVILNCSTSGSISVSSGCGGIVGYNEGTVSGCENGMEVNTTYQDTTPSLDELDDALDTILQSESLLNTGSLSSDSDIGGIAGFSSGVITSCTNRGDVGYEHVGYNVGGIVGRSSGYLAGNTNYGAICGRKDVGGIAGQVQPYLEVSFTEETLQDLETELDKLSDLISSAAEGADSYGTAVSNHLTNITGLLEIAEDSAADLMDGAADTIDEAAENLNTAGDKMQTALTILAAAGSEFDDYMDGLGSALSGLADIDLTSIFGSSASSINSLLDQLADLIPDGSSWSSSAETAEAVAEEAKELLSELDSELESLKEELESDAQNALSDLSEESEQLKSDVQDALSDLAEESEQLKSDAQDALSDLSEQSEQLKSDAQDVLSDLSEQLSTDDATGDEGSAEEETSEDSADSESSEDGTSDETAEEDTSDSEDDDENNDADGSTGSTDSTTDTDSTDDTSTTDTNTDTGSTNDGGNDDTSTTDTNTDGSTDDSENNDASATSTDTNNSTDDSENDDASATSTDTNDSTGDTDDTTSDTDNGDGGNTDGGVNAGDNTENNTDNSFSVSFYRSSSAADNRGRQGGGDEDADTDNNTATEDAADSSENAADSSSATSTQEEISSALQETAGAAGSTLQEVADTAGSTLEDVLSEVQSNISSYSSALDTLTDASDIASSVQSTLSDVSSLVSSFSVSSPDLSDLTDSIDDAADAISDTEDLTASLSAAMNVLASIDLQFSGVSDSMRSSGDNLYESISQMTGEMEALNQEIRSMGSSASDDLEAISDQFNVVMDTLIDTVETMTGSGDDEEDEAVEDTSEEDIESTFRGRSTGSTNYGSINADVNVGGIVGVMGVEYSLDPELDIEVSGSTSLEYIFQAKCIVDDSINYGTITTRSNYAGGIAGNMEMGLVSGCENYGALDCEGKYIGGIAGYSAGTVRSSTAKCEISGDQYVGGIAGYGTTLRGNVAMVNIDEEALHSGAIAGAVDSVDSAVISDNYYYSADSCGIGNISYTGIAEGLSYEALLALENLPDTFDDMTLSFYAEDELVSVLTCGYGEAIGTADLPEIPEKDGFYGVWSRTDYSSVVADEVITAEYIRYTTLLTSGQTRGSGLAAIQVLGRFHTEDTLTVTGLDPEGDEVERWSITIPDDGADTHEIRFLIPDDVIGGTLYLVDGDTRTLLDPEDFGSYLSFEAAGNEITLALEDTMTDSTQGKIKMAILILVLLAAAILLIVLIVRGIRRAGRRAAKQS